MKKAIAIFLILVLGVQLLPIKAMGKCLYENAFTEEQCEKKFISEKDTADDIVKPPLFFSSDRSFLFAFTIALIAEPNFAIISPPPNSNK